MDSKQVRFAVEEMLHNPPIFAEAFMDFDSIAYDPRQNPLYI